ncbi:MAG: N-6 DNA methylase [Bacteroidaceae bacterium]|nr:N-6 DNA methylase [Bacteroidaceae bacterium]
MAKLPRIDIIDTIGRKYQVENIENGEFSYQQVIERHIVGHYKLDIRFYNESQKVAVLVETKDKKFKQSDVEQLFDYVKLEQELSSVTKIIAILAGTHDGSLRVWKILNDENEELSDAKLKSFEEYSSYFIKRNVNDKTRVLENTAALNRILHDNGIQEGLRSQFVGTCLLALKEGLVYKRLSTPQILAGIKVALGNLLQDSVDKANKISILDTKVLQDKNVLNIESENFSKLLDFIKEKILPYINEASTEGHDILSYFFTTFNKYVQKGDKNQAFTPNHIAHFMCKVGHITRNTVVLDPTCGSGTFLVQAMSQALAKCETDTERRHVKEKQIYGIEVDEKVYGLATTNMLIHGDGNSNIYWGSCFDEKDTGDKKDIWKLIKDSQNKDKRKGKEEDVKFDLVLMNPPYNASKTQVDKSYAMTWGKSSTDPSKGLHFVEHVANVVKTGRLITLLPMQAAIGDKGIIAQIKRSLLEKHTLDAVFSFPTEMFYPGASAVACCMVFDLGKPHKDTDRDTFFGYYRNDGFEKRKGVGRVDIKDRWEKIEEQWLSLYEHRSTQAGLCVTHKVSYQNEWCAEAYMKTDFSTLCDEDFINNMKDYAAFVVLNERKK